MITRRSLLRGLSLGSGAVALSPFLRHIAMLEAGQVPKRFVFVMKSSGLQPNFIDPVGLKNGGDKLVDEPLGELRLAAGMEALDPFRDRLTILQGLSGRMCSIGHSGFYGALGGYRAKANDLPLAATIDGHLAKHFPSVFHHIGLKMGKGNVSTTYPQLSALGKNKQLPYQCDPQQAYMNLFGSIVDSGDIKKKYQRSGSVLDFVAGDIKKLRKALPGQEQEKLDHYLGGFESLRDRRVKLVSMQKVLKEHAPGLTDKYTSEVTTHHLEAHFDMATAALITGITNVASISTCDLSSSYQGLGITPSVHSFGHGASSGELTAQDCRNLVRKFHFELIAGMAKKLAAVPEGDGTMLDNTVIVYVSDNSNKHHSTAFEWPMVVLGNMGGSLKSKGRYLCYPKHGATGHRTIGNWLTTLCHVAGIPQDYFGQPDLSLGTVEEQNGPLAELV